MPKFYVKSYQLVPIFFIMWCMCTTNVLAQGYDCASAIPINTLPFSDIGNTCGAENFYNNTHLCGNNYLNAEELVYTYTPGASESCISISVSSNFLYIKQPTIFITKGCPDAQEGECVAQSKLDDSQATPTALIEDVKLIPGEQYYILVSEMDYCYRFSMEVNAGQCSPVPEGVNCEQAEVFKAFPDQITGTTCMGNSFLNQGNGCGNTFYDNPQYFYTFTPINDRCITITGKDVDQAVQMSIYSDCPTKTYVQCDKQLLFYPEQDKSYREEFEAGTNYYLVIAASGVDDGCSSYTFLFEEDLPQGMDCNDPIEITSSTYSDINQTTSCMRKDYIFNKGCNLGTFQGQDVVYAYEATVGECISFTLKTGHKRTGVFLYDVCPSADNAQCLASDMTPTFTYYGIGTATINYEVQQTGKIYMVVASDQLKPITYDAYFVSSLNEEDDNSCANPFEIVGELPITITNKTTNCRTDKVSGNQACGYDFMYGSDYIFKYTPTSSFCGTVVAHSNQGSGSLLLAESCWNTCLKTAYCQTQCDSTYFDYQFEQGKTYFITANSIGDNETYSFDLEIRKSWDTPDGCFECHESTCVDCLNTDFELGTFQEWEGAYGSSTDPSMNSGLETSYVNAPTSRHTLVTAGTYDAVVGPALQTTSPNNSRYVVRLGNRISGSKGEQLTYKFNVTNQNHIFFYNYAVVLEDPQGSHGESVQPYFSIKMSDANGNSIPCSGYEVRTSSTDGTFYEVKNQIAPSNTILWKDWSQVAVPLENYIGQEVTIDFVVKDCGLGGHFGYAYIDAFCSDGTIKTKTNGYVCEGELLAVEAPGGFKSYTWNTGETTQTIYVDKTGYYEVNAETYSGCFVQFHLELESGMFPEAAFDITPTLCSYDTLVVKDKSVSNDDYAIKEWIWDFGDGNGYEGQYPEHQYDQSGTYNVQLVVRTDAGCDDTLIAPVTVSFLDLVLDSIAQPTCSYFNNGYIEVGAEHAVKPFQYTFNGESVNTTKHGNLGEGTYQIIVSDSIGCVDTLIAEIVAPDSIVAMVALQHITCFGDTTGQINISGNGGTAPLSYRINRGAEQATGVFNDLAAGVYFLEIEDDQGCELNTMVNILQEDSISARIEAISLTCYNDSSGAINVHDVSGGVGDKRFSLNQQIFQQEPSFGNLLPGMYTVTIKDSFNCVKNYPVTITEPAPVVMDIELEHILCFGESTGVISVAPNGGTGDLLVNLDDSEYLAEYSYGNLPAHQYHISVKDENDCVLDTLVELSQESALQANISVTENVCVEDTAGAIVLHVSGGAQPYQYALNQNNWVSHPEFEKLVSGTHSISIKDKWGCLLDTVVVLNDGEPLAMELVLTEEVCVETTSATVNIVGTGGKPAYQYKINNESFVAESTYEPLSHGVHDFYIKDAWGCVRHEQIEIEEYIPSDIQIKRINIPDGDETICGPRKAYFEVEVIRGQFDDCLWDFRDGFRLPSCDQYVDHMYYIQGKFKPTFTAYDQDGCLFERALIEPVVIHNQSHADFRLNPVVVTEEDNFVNVINRSVHAETEEWQVNGVGWNYSPWLTLNHLSEEYEIMQITKTKMNCNDTLIKVLPVLPATFVNIPNAFTPNGNGGNEIFKPILYNVSEEFYSFEIYDRWGELIFITHDTSQGWDGTYKDEPAQLGVYVYVVTVKNQTKTKTYSYRNTVNLLR